MTSLPSAFAPGSDAGLSDDARLLYEQRIRGLIESPSVSALSRKAVLKEIEELTELANVEDWDGEGAAPVEQSTLRYATRFLLMMPQGRQAPSVVVDRNGEITFDWGSSPSHTFSVSVGRDGTLTYAGLFGGAQSWGYEKLEEQFPLTVFLNIARASC